MRALVAGCAGFIGFHLTNRLLEEGHEVVGIDNLCTGQSRNVTDLQKHARFRFVSQDITQPLSVEGRFDRVFDLACPASPIDFGPLALEILAVCSRGVWNLLEFARERGARFLHTSTSEVYGDPTEHPQREEYWGHVNPIGPRSCYDEGKRFGESLITCYRARYGVETRMVRIFNTYGPRMRPNDGRVLPNFINQALHGDPLTVYGDGKQTRSFCYVSDQVDGILRLMESNVSDPVNVGNPIEITMLTLAEEVIRLTGSTSKLAYKPMPQDDPKQRCPDITRATTLLGWEPRVPRHEGIRNTIEWFRANPD